MGRPLALPDRRPARLERLAGGDPQRLPRGDRADLLRRVAELERAAQLERGRHGRVAVRRVAGEHDLAGRDQREQRLEVGRHPPRGVEQQVREIGGHAPDPGQIADAGVGEDQAGVRELLGQLDRVQAERRDAAAGVDQHRQRALVGERDQGPHDRMIERELLGAGMQLDPACAGGQARSASATGIAVRVDPAERDEQPVGLARPRRARRRWPAGSRRARASGTRTRRARRPPRARRWLGAGLLHPVGVVLPQVRVGVEQLDPGDLLEHDLRPGAQGFDQVHRWIRTMKTR